MAGMTSTYLAAEGSAHGWLPLAVIPAVVALYALAAMHAPELRRWVARERRHRADLRRVTGGAGR